MSEDLTGIWTAAAGSYEAADACSLITAPVSSPRWSHAVINMRLLTSQRFYFVLCWMRRFNNVFFFFALGTFIAKRIKVLSFCTVTDEQMMEINTFIRKVNPSFIQRQSFMDFDEHEVFLFWHKKSHKLQPSRQHMNDEFLTRSYTFCGPFFLINNTAGIWSVKLICHLRTVWGCASYPSFQTGGIGRRDSKSV